ncbi:hypothetical protein [Pantoea ananatis]|uniref:hypothetical protein n=1 Tax=Pantoea ananas TaxID=553 RepID=UPI0004951663|nr:hypothetical protein [Pantoea ananatis]
METSKIFSFAAFAVLTMFASAPTANAQTFNGCPSYTMEDIKQWNKEGKIPVETLIQLPLSMIDVIKHEQECRYKFIVQQKERISKELNQK